MTQTLVSEEEEATVTDEPAANVAPKLVEAERKPGRNDWVAGIEDVIAQKIEQAAMRSVRAGLRGYVHLAAGGASVFCGKEHGVDTELFDGVGRDRNPDEGLLCLIDDVSRVYTVVGKVVVIQPTACKANTALIASACIDGPGNQCRQSRPVAAVQWKVPHLLGLGAAALHVARFVELGSAALDIDLLGHVSHAEREVELACVTNRLRDVLEGDLPETGHRARDAVEADG